MSLNKNGIFAWASFILTLLGIALILIYLMIDMHGISEYDKIFFILFLNHFFLINYFFLWSGSRESNPLPNRWQRFALPMS